MPEDFRSGPPFELYGGMDPLFVLSGPCLFDLSIAYGLFGPRKNGRVSVVVRVGRRRFSGGYCGGVPPLPIPNREVKPACADGTAMQCGRVGGRLFLQGPVRVSSDGTFFRVRPTWV